MNYVSATRAIYTISTFMYGKEKWLHYGDLCDWFFDLKEEKS